MQRNEEEVFKSFDTRKTFSDSFLNTSLFQDGMFYRIQVQDHVRVPPKLFGDNVKKSVLESAKKLYTGLIDQELGVVVTVEDIKEIGEGVIIPGDGASYYTTILSILSYKPELQEVVTGKIREIADFGAFLTLGPLDGMIHVSQTLHN